MQQSSQQRHLRTHQQAGQANITELPPPPKKWARLMLRSTVVELLMKLVWRLTGKAPALKMVKSGFPKLASSSSVGRMSMLYMNRQW